MNPQIQKIKESLPKLAPSCGESIVISIDGPAGSGKTTLANELSQALEYSYTIHMDDLYEGWASTLSPKLTSKLSGILNGVATEHLIRFSPFNWLENGFSAPVELPAPKFLIIEGVGSGQSAVREWISLQLWIEVSSEVGLKRVINRDGPAVAQFMPAFLVAQDSHFEKEATKKSADYRLSGQGTV